MFFIDILYYFNSRSEIDLPPLFKLVEKSIKENDILLKGIAKTVLSNNLILSEISVDELSSQNSYTLKNLKRIRDYIGNGVLSVKESIEDIREKEIKQKIQYWLKRINEDEGEKLEFTATFKTAIPNKNQQKIITSLKKQLKQADSKETEDKIAKRISDLETENSNVKGIEKILIHSSLKTICAFANTKGGHLLIGVSDDKEIYGLESDYNSFGKEDQNRDGFGKYFDDNVKAYFGDSFSSTLLEKEFLNINDKDILIVTVKKSFDEIFIRKNAKGLNEESIYVRNLSSSNKLKGKELSRFIKSKFREQFKSDQ